MSSPSKTKTSEFLTSEEVVERLLALPHLRSVTATCVLPAIRVGVDWRFRRSDLESWIAAQSAGPVQS